MNPIVVLLADGDAFFIGMAMVILSLMVKLRIHSSLAGATTSSALIQSKGIVIPHSLVIIEIGGNDMLGNMPSARFFKALDVLLANIHSSSHCVMFELPLLPFHNGYGEAQRILARKYDSHPHTKKMHGRRDRGQRQHTRWSSLIPKRS